MRVVAGIILILLGAYVFYTCNTKASSGNISESQFVIAPDSSYSITTDINDLTDPMRSKGIDFIVEDANDPSIMISSSNPMVIPSSNVFITGSGTHRNLKIAAIAPGYATVTVKVTSGNLQRNYILNYAASQTMNMQNKRWHAGIADASAAICLDDNCMMVANDESNCIYLYDRTISGPPLKVYDYNEGNKLNLTDSSSGKWKEVDVEGGVRSITNPSVTYWIGSMSNNSSFLYKPNRNRLFAISMSGKGKDMQFTNQGYYGNLREKLVSWGDRHGYNFKACAAVGKDCKTIDGFNIEGMVFGPDNKTLFIAFRAPLVPMKRRTKALIAPIQNFESWFNNGMPVKDPQIGKPIELDLGGRGIRDIVALSNNNYVIIAGSSGWEIKPAAYSWTGRASDPPILLNFMDLTGLNVEGVIPTAGTGLFPNSVQMLTDNGTEILYCDTLHAKDLLNDRFKKFSSVIFSLIK